MLISMLIQEFLFDCEVRELTEASGNDCQKQLKQFNTSTAEHFALVNDKFDNIH